MKSRSGASSPVSKKSENGSQKNGHTKDSSIKNGANSLKRPRNPQDELINSRLRSAKTSQNELQVESPLPQKKGSASPSAKNGALSVPVPKLTKAVSKSANTSREASPTRITLQIPQIKENTRKGKGKTRSCPGSPPGKSPKRNDDMMEEEKDVRENVRIFSTPNDKIKAYWIIPIKSISGIYQKRIELNSVEFSSNPLSKKQWQFNVVITKAKERALFSDSLEVVVCPVKSEEEEMNEDWKREQAVTLQVIQKDGNINYDKSANKVFNELNPKWGVKFDKDKVDLSNKSSKLIISCILKDQKVSKASDVKYAGLVNAGNTCYMNSFLQTLYHLGYLSRLVFKVQFSADIPLSIPSALQKLFYNLTKSNSSVRTTELTKSFGWNSKETSIQQDVQEFCCLLLDALDAKTKGVPGVENKINELFEVD